MEMQVHKRQHTRLHARMYLHLFRKATTRTYTAGKRLRVHNRTLLQSGVTTTTVVRTTAQVQHAMVLTAAVVGEAVEKSTPELARRDAEAEGML